MEMSGSSAGLRTLPLAAVSQRPPLSETFSAQSLAKGSARGPLARPRSLWGDRTWEKPAAGPCDIPRSSCCVAPWPQGPMTMQGLGPDLDLAEGSGDTGDGSAGLFGVTGQVALSGQQRSEACLGPAHLHSLSSRTTASTRRLPSRPPWPCLSPKTDSMAQPLGRSPPAWRDSHTGSLWPSTHTGGTLQARWSPLIAGGDAP